MQQALPIHPPPLQFEDKLLTNWQELGRGAFGVVYKVTDKNTFIDYALKLVRCSNVSEHADAHREVQTLAQVSRHPNVIAMMGALDRPHITGRQMLILTEYCGGGTLNERLNRPSDFWTNFKWMHQAAAALAFLHSCNVVHRDLKLQNVLLTATEDVKLADFGLARVYIALNHVGPWTNNFPPSFYMNSYAGTKDWMAPEVFSRRYTKKADVFSLGAIFLAILQRDYVVINGKAFYGAYWCIGDSVGKVHKVGLGRAMAMLGDIELPSFVQEDPLPSLAHKALSYYAAQRPTADQIYAELESLRICICYNNSNQCNPYLVGGMYNCR